MQNPYVIRDRKNAMRKATEHAKKRAREMDKRMLQQYNNAMKMESSISQDRKEAEDLFLENNKPESIPPTRKKKKTTRGTRRVKKKKPKKKKKKKKRTSKN